MSHASSPEYAHLGYSKSSDAFIFCNKISFDKDDTESLIEQEIKATNKTIAQVKDKTSEELITDLKYVPCLFYRDELFSIVVVNDSKLAEDLKHRNRDRNLTVEEMTALKKDDS